VEGGKTPLCSTKELEEWNYKLVIYPNTLLRLFAKVGLEALPELYETG
jgi:2-methylisocitrate lyase-like PEP mutase family enzyme